MRRDRWTMDNKTAPTFKFSFWSVLGAFSLLAFNLFESVAALFSNLAGVFYGAANYKIARAEMADQARLEIEQLTSGVYLDDLDEEDDYEEEELEDEDLWSDEDGR